MHQADPSDKETNAVNPLYRKRHHTRLIPNYHKRETIFLKFWAGETKTKPNYLAGWNSTYQPKTKPTTAQLTERLKAILKDHQAVKWWLFIGACKGVQSVNQICIELCRASLCDPDLHSRPTWRACQQEHAHRQWQISESARWERACTKGKMKAKDIQSRMWAQSFLFN